MSDEPRHAAPEAPPGFPAPRGPRVEPAPSPWSADEGDPPLLDPYLAPPDPPRAELSRLALTAVLAWPLTPVGSVLSIVFGWYARREIERSGGRRTGYALATTAIVLGAVATAGWGALAAHWLLTHEQRIDPAGDEPPAAAPPPAPTARPPQPLDLGPWAPKHTKVRREGAITVIDLGTAISRFEEELARQRADAQSEGETLVVMTTSRRCDPCRGVDRALTDPLMQTALTKVRLVRVDVQVFHDDLEQLRIPDAAIPGFFLLAPDLTPRDAVDGGEWDEDVAENIAPVLGAFVKGKYATRRRPWTPPPPSGITL